MTHRGFYAKLAAINIRNNAKVYVPYLLTCIGTVMMYAILFALSQNSGLERMHGGELLHAILSIGTNVVGIFSVIFLFYTNSFLIKRRKKEFGLFNVLGMGKRHIARVMMYETLYIALFSIGVGLG
ncbi:MAG: FtsX-like permease family protein, partial [Clostridia bacterium]